MTSKSRIILILAIVSAIFTAALLDRSFRRLSEDVSEDETVEPTPTTQKPSESLHDVTEGDAAAQNLNLEANVVYLPTYDPRRTMRIKNEITEAIETGSVELIRQSFHTAAYSRGYKNSELQEAFFSFLNHSTPYIRYLSARYLYLTGDTRGKDTLLSIITNPGPLVINDVDYRILSAQVLAKYREKEAAKQITGLYEETKNGTLLSALALLSIRHPDGEEFPYVGRENALTEYGLVEARDVIPDMRQTFNLSENRKVRLGAARSLAQKTGEDVYVDYLVELAEEGIAKSRPAKDDLKAIKYLGSINSPKAYKVLLEGLKHENRAVVEYSTVNLFFNQGLGEQAAKNFVLAELNPNNSKNFKLSEELKWNLVSAMTDDEDIVEAAKAYSNRTKLFDWEFYVVERQKWPVYNWVDNYVVELN